MVAPEKFRYNVSEATKRRIEEDTRIAAATTAGRDRKLGKEHIRPYIVMIQPKELLEKVHYRWKDIDTGNVVHLQSMIKSGAPVMIPPEVWVDDDGNIVRYDGPHRAMASICAGLQQIPIILYMKKGMPATKQFHIIQKWKDSQGRTSVKEVLG